MGNDTQVDSSKGLSGTYVAPKVWEDITDGERIERMREIIKQMQYQISLMQGNVQDIKNDFQNHAHVDGKIYKDIKTSNNCRIGLGGSMVKTEGGKSFF
jgi:hypothetical protein